MVMEHLEQLANLLPDIKLREALLLIRWNEEMKASCAQQEVSIEPCNFEFAHRNLPDDSTVAQDVAVPEVAAAGTATPKKGSIWTEDEKARARALKSDGHTARQIAATLGRPVPATAMMLKRLRAEDENKTFGRFGATPRPKKITMPSWTPRDLDRALAMSADGKSYEAIGLELGRTASAVKTAIARQLRSEDAKEREGFHATSKPRHAPETVTSSTDRAEPRKLEVRGSVDQRPAQHKNDLGHRSRELPHVGKQRPASGAEQQPHRLDHLGGLDVADATGVDPAAIAENPTPYAPPVQRLTALQKRIFDHLKRLSDDFTIEDDLYLAEAITGGTPSDVIADQLGCDTKTVVSRFRVMQVPEILTAKNTLTISGQTDLLVALRWRAGRYE